jgi:Ring finger domain
MAQPRGRGEALAEPAPAQGNAAANGSGSEANTLLITAGAIFIVALVSFFFLYTISLFSLRRRRRRRMLEERREDGAFASAMLAPPELFTDFLRASGLNKAELDRLCPERAYRSSPQALAPKAVTGLGGPAGGGGRPCPEAPSISPPPSSAASVESRTAGAHGEGACATAPGAAAAEGAAVDAVPEATARPVQADEDKDEEGDVCVVCIEQLRDGEMERVMPCSKLHRFHSQCIQVWLAKSLRCPICNEALEMKREKRRGRRRHHDGVVRMASAATTTGGVAGSGLGSGGVTAGVGGATVHGGGVESAEGGDAAIETEVRGGDGGGGAGAERGWRSSRRRRRRRDLLPASPVGGFSRVASGMTDLVARLLPAHTPAGEGASHRHRHGGAPSSPSAPVAFAVVLL